MIKNESSDSEINTINHNMKPEELKAFIIERSEKIEKLLKREYQKFLDQNPRVPSPDA